MTLRTVQTLRLAFGVWASIAVSYGMAWPLSFVTPIFAGLFLSLPTPWFGWKMGFQLIGRLAISLLIGLVISEVFLGYPMICILLYGLLFFIIYYNDTPAAPPMAVLFMTLGITLVPIMGLQGSQGSHFIAMALFWNMALGLVFAWLFHGLVPNNMAKVTPAGSSKKPDPPPPVSEDERIRLALVSTIVALTAIIIFFSLNLTQYALAMIYICFMAGSPTTNASKQAMKGNALATCIGGIAVIIVFNLLVAVPTYAFLLAVSLLFCTLFAWQIFSGNPLAKAFASGFTAFLALLGSSTGVDNIASTNFYLRIAQVLFAGFFTIAALIVVEHFMRPDGKFRFFYIFKKTA